MLRYFSDRARNSTSVRGKKGYQIKIRDLRKELLESHGLKQKEVVGNLQYLEGQGWIKSIPVPKNFRLPSGVVQEQVTPYYTISAEARDKVEGEGEFTMEKYRSLTITGDNNVVTMGDKNKVAVQYQAASQALKDLKQAVLNESSLNDAQKKDAVADIEVIEGQIVKTVPNRGILQAAWDAVKGLDTIGSIAEHIIKVSPYVLPYLT